MFRNCVNTNFYCVCGNANLRSQICQITQRQYFGIKIKNLDKSRVPYFTCGTFSTNKKEPSEHQFQTRKSALLLNLHLSYTKYCCVLCKWESWVRSLHYKKYWTRRPKIRTSSVFLSRIPKIFFHHYVLNSDTVEELCQGPSNTC